MNTNYEKEFVPYKQALELKKLGFDESCLVWYNSKGQLLADITIGYEQTDFLYTQDDMEENQCIAPTFSQAFRWFRDKYGLKISFPYWNGFNKMIPEDLGRDKYEIMIIPANHRTISVRNPKGRIWFDTYEQAELECLKKLIEIVKQQL